MNLELNLLYCFSVLVSTAGYEPLEGYQMYLRMDFQPQNKFTVLSKTHQR